MHPNGLDWGRAFLAATSRRFAIDEVSRGMTSAVGAEGACGSTSLPSSAPLLPEDGDAFVHVVTKGLADLLPGPQLAKECAARRGEIWTIVGQLQEVVRFTEQAMKDEDRQKGSMASQHSHRLRLAADLLQGLLRGANALEQFDRDGQPGDGYRTLAEEFSSMRTSVGSLSIRIDEVSSQLKERDLKLAPDGREDVRSRLISPLLGAASSAVTFLGASAISRCNGTASRAVEASSELGAVGGSVAKSSAGAADAATAASRSATAEDSCTRCRRRGATRFCQVALRSVFDGDPPCRHGPFCHRCQESLANTVLATCTCRALISSWLTEDAGAHENGLHKAG